ncbi:MAG: HAD-IA family hydrolase [Novosphingobium sp.]|nr:HAD-IA family hydrolase [Novosphingobium sp.]
MTVRLAVFDCDGTLVDGQHAVCAAMDDACATVGIAAPNRQAVRRIVGLSLPLAVRRLLPDASEDSHAAVVEAYKTAYRSARERGALAEPLFDGIAGLLATLHDAGWSLGVATGKSDRGVAHCLASHGLAERFTTLQTADRHPSKPHPAMLEAALAEAVAAPEHSVMIGDTVFDMAMARAAGVRALGVAWGYHAPHELIEAGAEFVAADPAALQDYLLE